MPYLCITPVHLSNIISPLFHSVCLSYTRASVLVHLAARSAGFEQKPITRSPRASLMTSEAPLQLQLMEGMQLTSTLAPERLEQVRACVCMYTCVYV